MTRRDPIDTEYKAALARGRDRAPDTSAAHDYELLPPVEPVEVEWAGKIETIHQAGPFRVPPNQPPTAPPGVQSRGERLKLTPWQRIARAAEQGRGVRLSADDVQRLIADGDILTVASMDAELMRHHRDGHPEDGAMDAREVCPWCEVTR